MNKKNITEILKSASHYSVFYADIEKEVNGEFVKKLRKKLNMTQNFFASVLGVTKKTIEKWEQGANPVKGCAARLLFLINKDTTIMKELYNFEHIQSDLKDYEVPSLENTNVTFSNYNIRVKDDNLTQIESSINIELCC